MSSYMGSGLPPLSMQDILDNAGRLVDKFLQDDKSYPDLSSLLNITTEYQASLSGLYDQDYPNLAEVGYGLDSVSEVSIEKRVPLPPELVEQFSRMQCNCMMGLFPEIERAWLTIDSDIFVWKYEDGSDLAYFDGLNETILSAALLRPKPGIFQPHIQYLMCLATPVDIILLGVSFYKSAEVGSGDHRKGEMHLLPDPLFSIPTDGVYITSIVGAENGRVFMAGKDGCLYELVYQADDGWFSRKCRKVNHSTSSLSFLIPSFLNFSFSEDDPIAEISIDNTRGILYARTQKGTIQVFDLGEKCEGMSRIAAQTQSSILHSAANVARTIESSSFKSIVHISAVTAHESNTVQLVAVTESGVRLYFCTIPFKSQNRRPTMLSLVHVRLPPGFSATSAPLRPTNVHTAHYSRGTLLLVSSQSKDTDLLWGVSPDSFCFPKQMMEASTILPIEGKTWAVNEVTAPAPPPPSGKYSVEPPCVVTQHALPPRRFVLLSAQGIHILQKFRPVEQLRHLMIECGGPDAQQIKAFFNLHRLDQACATCLVLACSRSSADQQVSDWARMAFFMYGGEAQYHFTGLRAANISGAAFTPSRPGQVSMYSPGNVASPNPMMTHMPGMAPIHMSTPIAGQVMHPQMPMASSSNPAQEIVYSGKHNGIYIYLCRILRPFWEAPVCTQFVAQKGSRAFLTSSFSVDELCGGLELVRDLSDFVDFNSKFDVDSQTDILSVGRGGGLPGLPGAMDEHSRSRLQAEVQRMEKVSLQHAQDFLHRVEEVLGLWRILLDHQFHILAAALSEELQNQLTTMTFKMLVISGKEICTTLINCLVGRYLDDNAAIDAISDKLRQVCPTLYSSDDATCSKSNELLQTARASQDPMERQRQLQEALQLLKGVGQPLNLGVLAPQLASLHFYPGLLELGLHEARKTDPQGLALHFYQSGEPQEDIQGMQAYLTRMECYKCITDMLNFLWTSSVSPQTQAPSIPLQPGPPVNPDQSRMDSQQAEAYRDEVFQMALASDDSLFHAALYDWLFITNRAEKLLEINTPYVEQYLRRKVNMQTDNAGALDMLWKHYEKSENFQAATRILAQLAERQGSNINLTQRLEYLSRAVICAKSSTSRLGTSAAGEMLHELEEKMEVARLQMQVYKCISNLGNSPDKEAAKNKLDSELLDITSLYEDFADRFDLHEMKLAIVHCAGLYDSALIENLWQNIIDKELASTAQMSSPDRLTSVIDRLSIIAKLYVKAERYFPVATILHYLEQRSCEQNLSHNWVYRLLLDVGVPPAKLLELYDRLYKSKDATWRNSHRPLHVLFVLQSFISHIASNPNLIPPSDRRHLINACLDRVSLYLVELQATSSTDPQVQSLAASFKATQSRLERGIDLAVQ